MRHWQHWARHGREFIRTSCGIAPQTFSWETTIHQGPKRESLAQALPLLHSGDYADISVSLWSRLSRCLGAMRQGNLTGEANIPAAHCIAPRFYYITYRDMTHKLTTHLSSLSLCTHRRCNARQGAQAVLSVSCCDCHSTKQWLSCSQPGWDNGFHVGKNSYFCNI